LVDRIICVGMPIGVGVCDLDAAEGLASDHTRALILGTIHGFEQAVVFVGVSVWPTIDSDRLNIARWIEATAREHASELFPNILLEGLEFCRDQFIAAGTVLIFAI